ncbi:MAG: vanadium-dependent haloperoxidase [Deltaproteobacteria bacterium]|nr:MAG: vanadium-dependent haloperoxidase [Deltaproteobacteria bacterium]
MKTVYDVVGTRVGERTGGETWRSSHRSGVKKLPRSWSILIVSIVGGAVLAGCGADDSGGVLLREDVQRVKLHEERGRAQVSNEVIVDWIVHSQDASGANSPPRRSRTFAMVSVAMHDAVNGIESKYARYASSASDPEASPVAAAAQAAHDVLVALFPAQQVDLDAKLVTSLSGVKDDDARARGIALGQGSAADLLSVRANDGSNVVVSYSPIVQPGYWRPTPPAFAPALEPGWGNVTPWGLASGSQFRSRAPYALSSAQYTADFIEVRDYGSATSAVRSDDQTSYAHFWYEPSAVGWNRLARTALAIRPKNIWKTARMFALMNMALADGYIASFDSKYIWQSWRPITFIREAGSDGNPNTTPDPNWTPLRPTPPIPDQTSGHAVAGFAARAALVKVFGDDPGEPMIMTSTTAIPTGSTRSWTTFTQAAAENADSRVMVGIHARQSVIDGEAQGRLVGDYVVKHQLRQLDD